MKNFYLVATLLNGILEKMPVAAWVGFSKFEKSRHLIYLQFISENSKKADYKKQKWIMENMDVDTSIIPVEYHEKFEIK